MRALGAGAVPGEYHQRDAKPGWWEFFDRLERTPQELCAEDSEAIGGLSPATDLPRGEHKRSWLWPLRFPPQQHKLGPGPKIDPRTEKGVKLHAVDDDRGIAWIARG